MPIPLPPEAAAAPQDSRFGPFIRTQRVGMGGMGEVWKAWDEELGRWVALKFLRSGDAEEIARFKREAHAAGRLVHPNIAAVYEVGEAQGRPFIAMQFIDGTTLRAVRADLAVRIRLVRDAARAVQFAHDHGIIHRDLKPDNLMVVTRGAELHAYVMDFGLAKVAAAASSLSASGMAIGTPAYMPPEQARGEVRAVDARSDVYSLGATLFEVIAGRAPFEGADAVTVLMKVVTDDAVPLRTLVPAVDADLDAIVQKCLEKSPDRRYPSAAALADDLDRHLRGEMPLAAASSSRWSRRAVRLRSWLSRHRGLAAGAALAAAALIAGLVALVAGRTESRRTQARIDAAERARPHVEEGDRVAHEAELLSRAPDPDTPRITSLLAHAMAAYGAALAENPTSADALAHRADVCTAMGNFDAAERDATAALALGDTPALRLKRAWIRTQRYESARDLPLPVCLGGNIERILRSPETSEAAALREQALDDLARAADGEPRDLVEGVLRLAEGKATEAFDRLDEVARRRVYDPAALLYRALAAIALADIPTAIEDLERSLLLRPASARAVLALAICEYARGDAAACAALLDRAAALGADEVAVLRLRGAADPVAARVHLDAALAKKPDDALTRLLLLLTRRAEAERGRGLFEVAEGLPERGQAAEYDDLLRPLLAKPVCPALAWLYHAQNLLVRDDEAGAEAALTRAVELDPSLDLARLWRAVARMRKGDWDGAMEDHIVFKDISGRAGEGHAGFCDGLIAAVGGRSMEQRLDAAGQGGAPACIAPLYLRSAFFHHDRAAALRSLARAAELASDWHQVYFQMLLAAGQGRAAEAAARRRDLARLRPDLRNLVTAADDDEAGDADLEAFRLQCRANPLDSTSQYNWAMHLSRRGRYDEALPLLVRNTYFYNPGNCAADLARLVLWRAGDHGLARVTRLVAKPWWTWDAIAERHLDLGDAEAALKASEEAIRYKPSLGQLRIAHIRARLALSRNIEGAAEDAALILEKNRILSTAILRVLAAAFWAARKHEEAAAVLERPGNARAKTTAARVREHQRTGRWKLDGSEQIPELLEMLLEARDLRGMLAFVDDAYPLMTLHGRGVMNLWRARAHELLGRTRDAVRCVDEAVPMLGDDRAVRAMIARIYVDGGRYDDARKYLGSDPIDHWLNIRILVATGRGAQAGPSIEALSRMGPRTPSDRLLGPAITRAEFERLVKEAGAQ